MTDPGQTTRSLSQYNSYVRCGEQYRLEKIARVPRKEAPWLAHGTAFHAAIEDWEISGREVDAVAAWFGHYDAEIDEAKSREPDLALWLRPPRYRTDSDIERRRELGAAQVRTYTANAVGAPWKIYTLPDDSPAVEVGFRLDLGTVVVTGYIDAVLEWDNGAVSVRDLKSGKAPAGALQLGVYALALNQAIGAPVTHGDFWLGKLGDDKTGAATPAIDLARYSEEYVTKLFTDLNTTIEQGIFLPNPGDHCRICPVRDYCREVGRLDFLR